MKMLNSKMIRSSKDVAADHRRADEDCGREWECACAACRTVRDRKLAVGDEVGIVGKCRFGRVVGFAGTMVEVRMNGKGNGVLYFRRSELAPV
jgi:hypothetical protein